MSEAQSNESIEIAGETLVVPKVLPVLPVRDAVVLPGLNVPLSVGRARSLAALDEAGDGGLLLVATQHDPATEDPGVGDLAPVGCICRILRMVDARQRTRQALVVGLARARILTEVADAEGVHDGPLQVEIEPLPEDPEPSSEIDAARKRVVELAHRLIDLRDDAPEEWKTLVSQMPTPGLLADMIASNIPVPTEDRIALLCEPDTGARLWRVSELLERELTIAETHRALQKDDAESGEIDPRRRERLLRRRMRDIQDELGEADSGEREADELAERLEGRALTEEARTHVDRELRRFRALPAHAPDRHLVRTYLEWIADLPWGEFTDDHLDLHEARTILDEDHHDLDKVKERILEYLAVRKLAPGAKAPILCFVGPPGVGKTSLGRSIARAMGRKFARASLGGVRDEAEIRGHRRTYVGAMPGRILQNVRRAGTANPVFLLDEIDKLGADFRGDPSSALLEVLDPEQNGTFSDHYLEVSFDLSKVLFIATANTLSTIPAALLDRMEVIELPGYTERDKLRDRPPLPDPEAARGPRTDGRGPGHDRRTRRSTGSCSEYTREAGVRNLDRLFATLDAQDRGPHRHRSRPAAPADRRCREFASEALGTAAAPPRDRRTHR